MDVRAMLEAEQDIGYRDFQRKLIPGCDDIIGVRAPVVKRIAKLIIKDDWRTILDSMDSMTSVEERMVVGNVIMNAPMPLDERISRIRGFIPHIDNWAVCDGFVYKPKNNERDEYWHILVDYINCGTEYGMRFAAVGMMQYMDDRLQEIFDLLGSARHDGYYLKMGVAWTLSMCFAKHPEETMSFLRQECPLDQWTYRKTLTKIVESYQVDDDTKAVIKEMRRSK